MYEWQWGQNLNVFGIITQASRPACWRFLARWVWIVEIRVQRSMCKWQPHQCSRIHQSMRTSSLGMLQRKFHENFLLIWLKVFIISPSTSKLSSCEASSRIDITYCRTMSSTIFKFAVGMCFTMNWDKLDLTTSWWCSRFFIFFQTFPFNFWEEKFKDRDVQYWCWIIDGEN